MKVFKFGGASVNDATGIRNLAKIVSQEREDLVIVVSAFGKTTNALEAVLKSWLNGEEVCFTILDEVYRKHLLTIDELFISESEVKGKIDISFANLKNYLLTETGRKRDFEYDQIVPYGEIISSLIL